MIKKVLYVGVASLAIVYLSLLLLGKMNIHPLGEMAEPEKTETLPGITSNEVPHSEEKMSKALVAKIVALTLFSEFELKTMDTFIDFEDCPKEEWFYTYVNAGVGNEWFESGEKLFNPYALITEKDVYDLFDTLSQQYNSFQISNYVSKKKDEPISYSTFLQVYMAFVKENQDLVKAAIQPLYVYTTESLDVNMGQWKVSTDHGVFSYGGLSLDSYINKSIYAVVNGKEIMILQGVIDEAPTVTNALIEKIEENDVSIFLGGGRRTFNFNHGGKLQPGDIIDFKIGNKGYITEINIKNKKEQGMIKRVDDTYVELEENTFTFSEDAQIYSYYNGIASYLGKGDLLVGSKEPTLIMENGLVCGAIIVNEPVLANIRVALNRTGFKGLIHGEVRLTSNGPFKMELDGAITSYEAGQILTFSPDKFEIGDKRARVYTDKLGDRIQVLSIDRGYGNYYRQPDYRGIIEVAKQDTGYTIVNELSLEEYLYAVVPSEMPSSYGIEASKVQAITARSYAYNQMYSNRYHKYGAHVDDSVNCQVYNNLPENKIAMQAVDETRDVVLKYGNNIVSANFFSTSCGYTANSGEVWAESSTGAFPQATPDYLQADIQYNEETVFDLRKEDTFYDFITSKPEAAYDSNSPWFRWEVKMSREEMEASIGKHLSQIYADRPYLVRTLNDNNIFRSTPIEDIGTIKDLHVYKRGEGGNVMELVIEGTKKTVKISTEYLIRQLIRPVQYREGEDAIELVLQDGSIKENYSLLPSAFFIPQKVKDKNGELLEVKFYGGGFGHGVGMSQNGVKGMVDQGYESRAILQHYYNGISVEKIEQ